MPRNGQTSLACPHCGHRNPYQNDASVRTYQKQQEEEREKRIIKNVQERAEAYKKLRPAQRWMLRLTSFVTVVSTLGILACAVLGGMKPYQLHGKGWGVLLELFVIPVLTILWVGTALSNLCTSAIDSAASKKAKFFSRPFGSKAGPFLSLIYLFAWVPLLAFLVWLRIR
jgi:hypothetical protein